MASVAWLNGSPADAALAFSRGLHYGDGVFRTLLKYDRQIIDIGGQLEKLAADSAVLGLRFDALSPLRQEIFDASTNLDTGVIKVLLLRAGAGRGYRPPAESSADRLVLCYPLPTFEARCWGAGITATKSDFTLATQPQLAGIKHLNRLEQVLASRNWPASSDEVILGDDGGRPICGSRSNLFWLQQGVLCTPLLNRCGVAGRMRARILTLAQQLGIETRIEAFEWHALMAADEAFVSNSLIGIWPLRQLDGQCWSAPGLMTADLMRGLAHPTLSSL
jgi:4-amino-4-deoxychorismate lyase